MASSMNQDNQVNNIIYKKYASTAIEGSWQESSNLPDSLISIMRDYIVVLDEHCSKAESGEKKPV